MQIDVRDLPKPGMLRRFGVYDALEAGEPFVVLTDDDPKHLRGELHVDQRRRFGWRAASLIPRQSRPPMAPGRSG